MKRMLAAAPAVLLLALLPAQEVAPAPPSACDRAKVLSRQGRHDAAIAVLRAAVTEGGAAEAERSMLARILAWRGRSQEALDVLAQGLGLGTEGDDASLQWEIGTIHRQLGDDGPFFRREGEMVAYLPSDDKVDEKAWRREHYRRALDAFLVVLARHPDSERTHELVGGLQARLELHEAALATWTAAAERFPGSVPARMGRARALVALERFDDAAAACEQALRVAPRLAAAHALLADHYARIGKPDEARRARQQADFHEWAPPFLELDFATANAAFVLLAPQLGEDAGDEQRERARRARAAEIDRLLAARTAESTRLLATLCYLHEDHGATEDRVFAELEARGEAAIPVLRLLLENARSTCTQKGSAHALARLRAPGLLPALLELLPGDIRPFHWADIAGALAELGDRGAIAPLLEVAQPAAAGSEEVDDPMKHGRGLARQRAVLALGVLGGDEVRTRMAAWREDPDVGDYCLAALYRITRGDDVLGELRAAVLAAGAFDQRMLLDYLERFAPEPAKALRDEAGKK